MGGWGDDWSDDDNNSVEKGSNNRDNSSNKFKRDKPDDSPSNDSFGNNKTNSFKSGNYNNNNNSNRRFGDNNNNRSNFRNNSYNNRSSNSYNNNNDNNAPSSKRGRYDNDNNNFENRSSGNFRNYNNYNDDRSSNNDFAANRSSNNNRSFGGSGGGTNMSMNADSNQTATLSASSPALMSFRTFVLNEDDSIRENEAVEKYGLYKVTFSKKAIDQFFENHKEEAWFIEKYHPDYFDIAEGKHREFVKQRFDIFMHLYERGLVEKVRLHIDETDAIARFMDMFIIRLEGGTEEDCKVLDMSQEEINHLMIKAASSPTKFGDDDFIIEKAVPCKTAPTKSPPLNKEENISNDVGDLNGGDVSPPKKERIKSSSSSNKKKEDDDSSSGNNSSSSSDSEDSVTSDKDKNVKENLQSNETEGEETTGKRDIDIEDAVVDHEEEEDEEERVDGDFSVKKSQEIVQSCARPLHKTHAIFLRNIPPSIKRKELVDLFQSYTGFKRLAIQDGSVEQKFNRRGWITFEYDCGTSVKEYCWQLNNMRFKDCDLGAGINREISQRVKPITVIANHGKVMKSDIHHLVEIIERADKHFGVWGDAGENVLLKLVSPELFEGCDTGDYDHDNMSERDFDVNEKLAKVVDMLILYLRAVYSIDYYSAIDYPNEDELPNRFGVIFVRGAYIAREIRPFAEKDLDDFMKNANGRFTKIIEFLEPLEADKALALGQKDADSAIETFVKANCVKLSDEKWLCPISGKKFKTEEFVRKHIFNKHEEKIKGVRDQCRFFNNFLRDQRRPSLPTVFAPVPSIVGQSNNQGRGFSHDNNNDGGNRGFRNDRMNRYDGSNNRGGGGRYGSNSGPRRDFRSRGITSYHDLDNPNE